MLWVKDFSKKEGNKFYLSELCGWVFMKNIILLII